MISQAKIKSVLLRR